jgi:hypothetical protein
MSTLGLGIFLGALGSVSINTGNNLQSLGMAQLEIKANEEAAEEEMEAVKNDASKNVILDEEIITPPEEIDSCQSPVWVIGTVIFVTGSLLNFAAFAFAPQSILASLEGIQFVTNVAFGRLVLGSHITNMMYFGTFITIVGVVLTVLSASVVGTLEATVNDLLVLWTNPLWLLYLLMCCGAGVALHVTHVAYEKAALAGKPYPNSDYVLPITYATFSALFGTFSVVLAKILSELLTLQLEFGVPIFYGADAWFTYVTLIAWITFAGIWLYRMNEALGLYDPLFIIPLLQVNFILFAIISGGIYFKEFSYFGPVNVIGFCLGVILLILGIFLLSPPIAIDTEDPLDKITLPSDVSFASIGPVGPTPPPATDGAARRISFTRRSISIRDLEGNVKSPVANKRGTLSHFKFGAVASMNDVQHDHNVNRAILSDKNMDESWKQERVNTRRRISAVPMGASRIVAVMDGEDAKVQVAQRRASRASYLGSPLGSPGIALVQSPAAQEEPQKRTSTGAVALFGQRPQLESMKEAPEEEDDEEPETKRDEPEVQVEAASPSGTSLDGIEEAASPSGTSLEGIEKVTKLDAGENLDTPEEDEDHMLSSITSGVNGLSMNIPSALPSFSMPWGDSNNSTPL